MIGMILAGLAALVLIAIVVGVVDARQAPRWRWIAAERRRNWEARQPQSHGVDHDAESWDDD